MRKQLLICTCILFNLACKTTPDSSKLRESTTHEGAAGEHSIYNEQENWPGVCQTGQRQSPIELSSTYIKEVAGGSKITPAFDKVETKVIDDGHAIKANVTAGTSSVTLDGSVFDLLQFHFHETSEHTLDGEVFSGEMHFVHKERSGSRFLALGLLLKERASGSQVGLENFFEALPLNNAKAAQARKGSGEKLLLPLLTVSPFDMIKANTEYFIYDGSLTTPPCTESVTHMVATDPVFISSTAMKKLRSYHLKTNRKLQQKNSEQIRNFKITRG